MNDIMMVGMVGHRWLVRVFRSLSHDTPRCHKLLCQIRNNCFELSGEPCQIYIMDSAEEGDIILR